MMGRRRCCILCRRGLGWRKFRGRKSDRFILVFVVVGNMLKCSFHLFILIFKCERVLIFKSYFYLQKRSRIPSQANPDLQVKNNFISHKKFFYQS